MKENISRSVRNRTYFYGQAPVIFLAATMVCGSINQLHGQAAAATQTLDGLRSAIAAYVRQPCFSNSLWGVKISSLDTGTTIFEEAPGRLMSPASNSKLYSAALALDHFGGDYRIATPIFATAAPDANGTVQGDLIVAGRADPTWNLHNGGSNFWGLFEPFVTVLKNAGVRHVTGDVVGDSTFIHGSPLGSGWSAGDVDDYDGAEISALTLEDNYTQVRVTPGASAGDPCTITTLEPCAGLAFDNQTTTLAQGGERHIENMSLPGSETVHILGQLPVGGAPEELDVPVPVPAKWFAAALKEALSRAGITVDGNSRAIVWPAPTPAEPTKLGEVQSPPLREILRDFLKPSQNLETDLTFEHTGESLRQPDTAPWVTSEELALAALRHFLQTNGLPAGDVRFDEGSGLSRNNLTTAEATVAVLAFMAHEPGAADYYNALPIAGVDGTLRHRMHNTPAAGNLHGKTGTLRWANSLSGYVTTAAGEKLVFSLMLNRYSAPPGPSPREALDTIAVMLSRFEGRSEESPAAKYADVGQLIYTQMVTAPFPHPGRAAGRLYHGQLYAALEHYSDSTVAMFIPKNFKPSDKVDLVVHFHGWNHAVAETLDEYSLIDQFVASGRNAILVVPQGPKIVPDSFGGKLADTNGFKNFIAEVADKLRASGYLGTSPFEIGNIIISGHSGGYQVMAAIVDHGGISSQIKEVWLFDALYAGTENFAAWQKDGSGRLLDIYTDHGGTEGETGNWMATMKTNGVSFHTCEDVQVTPDILRTNKIVILHTDMIHNDVVSKRKAFQHFLETSCLSPIPAGQ